MLGGIQLCMSGQRTQGTGDKVEPLDSSTNPEAALALDYQLCEPTNSLIVLVSWRVFVLFFCNL